MGCRQTAFALQPRIGWILGCSGKCLVAGILHCNRRQGCEQAALRWQAVDVPQDVWHMPSCWNPVLHYSMWLTLKSMWLQWKTKLLAASSTQDFCSALGLSTCPVGAEGNIFITLASNTPAPAQSRFCIGSEAACQRLLKQS